MNYTRRQFIRQISAITGGSIIYPFSSMYRRSLPLENNELSAADFGQQFVWAAAGSAFQTEGAWNIDGKGPSIWDNFTERRGKIKDQSNAKVATDFYHRFPEDITILKSLNFKNFRMSLSWPRIIPEGTGQINQKGVDFYNRLIDYCLECGITPWVTLYHWDLPQALEDRGGWTNRDIVGWFEDFCTIAGKHFGDRVKKWIVLNEPMSFTSLGYLLGKHAPGKRGFKNFLPAVHYASLCQSLGTQVMKDTVSGAEAGTTFSCSVVDPVDNKPENIEAAKSADAALNRLFFEPAMGMGYPVKDLPFLHKLEKYFLPGDEKKLVGNFDFIGIQYYFRVVAKHSFLPPLHAHQIKPKRRDVPVNAMGFEVYPEGTYQMLKKFAAYPQVKKIYLTESGVCYKDEVSKIGTVPDAKRIVYFKDTLKYILKAKQENVPVEGYFVWALTDNFEWSEGFFPRFGLTYIDYQNLSRTIKDSGKWFTRFLAGK